MWMEEYYFASTVDSLVFSGVVEKMFPVEELLSWRDRSMVRTLKRFIRFFELRNLVVLSHTEMQHVDL